MSQDAQGLSALSASGPPQRDGFATDCASTAATPTPACLSLEAGLCHGVSPALSSLLGYDPADLEARPYLELVHDQDRLLTQQALDQLKADEPLSQFENRFRYQNRRLSLALLDRRHNLDHHQLRPAPLPHRD